MTESDLKLIDFHVTDITCHVNTGVSEELPMSIKSSVSARMPGGIRRQPVYLPQDHHHRSG